MPRTRSRRLSGLALDALLVLMAVQAIVLMAQALDSDQDDVAAMMVHGSVRGDLAADRERTSSDDAPAHSRMLFHRGYVLLDSGVGTGSSAGTEPGSTCLPTATGEGDGRHACRDASASRPVDPLH